MIRAAIEKQVIGLTGLALGDVDFENPPGDPGLYGPQSVIWQVHSDFTTMLCGGVSALLLQMLHPLALAGVWDHSNFRDDMLGRLRRTSQFVSVTTFGPTAEAERLIAKVKAIHLRVNGVSSDGRPYAASDPDLLTWVHVVESSCFLASHLRYRNPHLSREQQDGYYRETARVAAALGHAISLSLARRSRITCSACGRSWWAMSARRKWLVFCWRPRHRACWHDLLAYW